MLAGDYLSYKGDWATNTAYNVNDCVTWTDGHLYEVIKAHTSSSTIAPSNTEYYKAMTARKFQSISGTIDSTGYFSTNIWDKISAEKSRGAYLALALSDRAVPLDFVITHVDKNFNEAYCMACNIINPFDGDAFMLFAQIIKNSENRTMLKGKVTKWSKTTDGKIEASTISASGFVLYYES